MAGYGRERCDGFETEMRKISSLSIAVRHTVVTISSIFYYFAPVRCAKYCDERVCLSVCPPLAELENRTAKLYQIFMHVAYTGLGPIWLGPPPLVALRHVMYFRFY